MNPVKIISYVRLPLLGRKEVIVGGVAMLGAFLIFLILWDAYLFYGTLVETRMRSVVSGQKPAVSVGEFDEVIRLLDERKDKYDSLLGK
ncbi:MAG: hypothetical protein HYW91_00835 [Candidatus Sungbacteria bacterium]|nr:hypothetical protein [Candidatus Sungbacteria bacterium]